MAYAASVTHDDVTKARGVHAIPVLALCSSLSLSLVISFVLCVLGYYILPSLPVAHGALTIPLPGFRFDSLPRFFLGLVESFAWGWYIALVFAPLYFAARFR